MNMLPETVRAKNVLKLVYPVLHILGRLCVMNQFKEEADANKLIDLNERFVCFIIVSGIHKGGSVLVLRIGGIVDVLVNATATVIAASVTCSGGSIPALTGKLIEILVFREAFPAILAVPVVSTFPWQRTLVL